jgi:hypothetical protein
MQTSPETYAAMIAQSIIVNTKNPPFNKLIYDTLQKCSFPKISSMSSYRDNSIPV